jgi:hypothetical protein
MRFRLHILFIALAFGPPTLAGGYFGPTSEASGADPIESRAEPSLIASTVDSIKVENQWASLENVFSLGKSDWCVGTLATYRHGPNQTKKGAWPANNVQRVSDFPIAINLDSGALNLLRPVQARVADIQPFDGDTCVIRLEELAHDPSDMTAEKDAIRSVVWQWNPATDATTKLGTAVPLAELNHALAGSPLRIAWPDVPADRWKGDVSIISTTRKESLAWKVRNTRSDAIKHLLDHPEARWSGSPDGVWEWNERFYPSADPLEFVSLLRFPPQDNGVRLRGLTVQDDVAVKWERSQEDIEKVIGSRLTDIDLVQGCQRPCSAVPLICETAELAGRLVTADAADGRLEVLFKFDSPPEASRMSLDGTTLACVVRDSDGGRRLQIWDARTKRVMRECSLESDSLGIASPSLKPDEHVPLYGLEGFDRHGNVMICDSHSLWLLSHPYNGAAHKVFALGAEKKVRDRER